MYILLKDKYPEIFAQIDVEKTLQEYPGLDIDNLTTGSNKKIWWKCSKGHTWRTKVDNRTKKNATKCPYCLNKKVLSGFNDFQTLYPELAKEWDYNKNYPVTPDQVMPGNHNKYWFRCPICGNSYQQTMINKCFLKHKCPYCSNQKVLTGFNDLATWVYNHPEYKFILDEWDYDKNELFPSEVFPRTVHKYWFKCKNGHEFEQALSNRTSKYAHGCPFCSHHHSTPEIAIYETIKNNVDKTAILGIKIHRWEIDIYLPCFKICIEYDGHKWHKSKKAKLRERKKNHAILKDKKNKYILIRIKESTDENKLKKYKELKGRLIIYYITKTRHKKYFILLSKILNDIFNISIEPDVLKNIFISKKWSK